MANGRGMSGEDFQALWQRLMRVARLDVTAFLEVRSDPAATLPAVIVVAVASLMSGIGGWLLYTSTLSAPLSGLGVSDETIARAVAGTYLRQAGTTFFIHSVIVGSLLALLLWFGWVAITSVMLERVWHRHIDFQALVRTMGLAYFPVGLSILMVIDAVATPIALIAMASVVLLSGVAVEAATEAEPDEVLFSNLVGFAAFALVLGFLGRNGQYAPGLFAFSL